ncbi:MAG TPA: Zn-ribbon domain-containing OB-fold protein [Methanoregulaceae archaeon]|nr:Zn-ribbon domain-containing OB-fold protein [Methanoregulaceae archaeon]
MSVARFWRKIPQRYNLIGTRCTTCGRYFFPPRSFCPECRRAGKIVDHQFAGNGTIVTFTVIRTASEQFEQLTPYVFAIIELDEGPRISAQIVCSPDDARIGMRVKPVFRRIAADGESGVIYYGTKYAPAD